MATNVYLNARSIQRRPGHAICGGVRGEDVLPARHSEVDLSSDLAVGEDYSIEPGCCPVLHFKSLIVCHKGSIVRRVRIGACAKHDAHFC